MYDVDFAKENEESSCDIDCLSGADLLMAATLRQQQEAGKIKLISQKLQTKEKFKDMKTRNNFTSSEICDDVYSYIGSESSCDPVLTGVSLECPSMRLAQEMRDQGRDCSNFDPVERAIELFVALDVDGPQTSIFLRDVGTFSPGDFNIGR
jgi:hypothetical protein